MAFSREEYDKSLDEVARKRIQNNRGQLESAKRAALDATRVTGDQHWDRFLEILQARINDCQERVEIAAKGLSESDDFRPEILIEQKLTVRVIGKELETLLSIIELPKTLMEQGDQAKELLGKIEETAS